MKKYLSLDSMTANEPLYHYTKCSAVQNILQTGVLFATKSSFLNDTNEMGYILHVGREVIADLPDGRWRHLLDDQIISTMEDFKRHDIFVLSFSEECDAITLWSEFGEETGYNLAFDGCRLLRRVAQCQKIYCHGRVLYSHDRQTAMLRHLITRIIPQKIGISFIDILENEIRHGGTEEFALYCRRLRTALNIYAMFFKQEEFAAEKEYRIVFKNPDKKRIRFREKDGFLLPYIEVDLSGGERLPVRKITVAPKNHVDLARKGMQQYVQMLGYEIPVELSSLKLRY